MHDSPKIGELRNGAKTKAGPLEAEQLSRLGTLNTHNLMTGRIQKSKIEEG